MSGWEEGGKLCWEAGGLVGRGVGGTIAVLGGVGEGMLLPRFEGRVGIGRV